MVERENRRLATLSEQGIKEAREAGRKLKAQGLKFDLAFTSALVRAQRTLDLMLEELGRQHPHRCLRQAASHHIHSRAELSQPV